MIDSGITAIASPVRRRLLLLVRAREQTPSELAEATGLTRPATSQHLRVLREAGLVTVRRDGGHRFYRVDEERFEALGAFLEDFWHGRFAALREAAERGDD